MQVERGTELMNKGETHRTMRTICAAVLMMGCASALRAQAVPVAAPGAARMQETAETVTPASADEAARGGATGSTATTLSVDAAMPDAPGEGPSRRDDAEPGQTAASTQGSVEPQQTKRIMGIVPNFRSVSAGAVLPPQKAKEKLTTGLSDSFDYSSFVFAGIQAGISQAGKSYPAFHQGAAGYGRYFWHQFADQANENLQVESLLPIVLHEDSRYYTLGHGGFLKRSVYSATRVLITRTDSGGETANVAEVLGAGGAAAVSSTYYPGQYRTWTKVGQRWLTNVILDGAQFYVKEFWPDINSKFSKGGM